MLLPWVYSDTKADAQKAKVVLTAAKERYQAALMAPFKVGNFLSTIDRTMELRSKQAKARAKGAPTKISLLR
jgi:hypothetical protein